MLNYECRYIGSHRMIHVPHSFAVLHLNGKTHYNQIKGYLAIFYTVLNKRWCSGSRTSQSILETFLFTDIYRPFQFTTPSTGTVTEVNKQPLCKWLGIHSHSRNFSVSSVLWGEGWHLCWIKVLLDISFLSLLPCWDPKLRIPPIMLAQEYWSIPLWGVTYMDGYIGLDKTAWQKPNHTLLPLCNTVPSFDYRSPAIQDWILIPPTST